MSRYDDMINLPHHVSETHPRMSMHDRAAQFSPFAALTGHSDAIREEARLTQEESALSQEVIDGINAKLSHLKLRLSERPVVRITYFLEDEKKSGGSYRTLETPVKMINEINQTLVTADGTIIPLIHIRNIEIS